MLTKYDRVLEPAYEDSDAEASLRTQRSRDVAVDVDWIIEQSKKPTYVSIHDSLKHAVY